MVDKRFLPDYPSELVIFETELEVAGLQYRKEAAIKFAEGHDQSLEWEREPENEHDQNAIRLVGVSKGFLSTNRQFLGYVPKDIAKRIVSGGFWEQTSPRLRHISISGEYIHIHFDVLGPKSERSSYRPRNPENDLEQSMPTRASNQRERFLNELIKRDNTLNGGILYGLDGYIIEMQARAMKVLNRPCSYSQATKISGMAHGAISEAKDRIAGAFAKCGIPDSEVEILVNLAPADLPKEGTWLDLPLALIMLQASGFLPDLPDHLEGDFILMGELGLHGEVRRVPGALSIAFSAKPGQSLIVPAGNEKECALILAKPGYEGCHVYPVSTLDEVIQFFQGKSALENALKGGIKFEDYIPKAVDFGLILGQERAKEAACIAAAGGHNLLLIGPPGEGKSLIATAIPGILPRLTNGEKVDLTKIYSAYGALENDGTAVTRRPMRTIHHTASKQSLIGGGSGVPRPGEITLAHLGVLFLDEIAEFSRGTLEASTTNRIRPNRNLKSWRIIRVPLPIHAYRCDESMSMRLLRHR